MNDYDIIVASAFGVEAVTKRELSELGINDAPAIDGRIQLKGDTNTIANLNMNLRTADRVFIKITEFPASTFDELFDGIVNANFEDYITCDGRILVSAKSIRSQLYSLSSIQSISKKAIIDRMKKAFNINDIVEDGADYNIEIAINRDYVTVLLDTSGYGLHKRGYRDKVWVAPLKETLAAALIKLSVWNPDKVFIDPFCGSGTLPIEAALIAHNIAPGINRTFAFESWNNFPSEAISLVREKAKDSVNMDRETRISGFDIDYEAIKLSEYHAERAGVKIHFEKKDMRDIRTRYSYGVIVTNPPYGERLLTEPELKILYRDFYQMFLSLDKWSLYVLSASDRLEEFFGQKSTKNRKLYNAQIECRLYTYMGEKPERKYNNND